MLSNRYDKRRLVPRKTGVPIQEQLAYLERLRPEVLDVFPSRLELLARQSSRGESAYRPRLVFSITDLTNPAMPLIRYATGDFATRGPVRGAFSTIDEIRGRVSEPLWTASGEVVSGTEVVDAILGPVEGIDSFSAVQHLDRSITVWITPVSGSVPDVARIRAILTEKTQGLEARIVLSERRMTTALGKHLVFRNEALHLDQDTERWSIGRITGPAMVEPLFRPGS